MEPYIPKEKSNTNRIWLLMLLCLLMGILINRYLPQRRPKFDADAVGKPIQPRGELAADESATIELFKKRAPAVVFITTAKVEFDMFSARRTSSGAGSGFIWDKNGHIVTNDHVIANSDEATVILSDKTSWPAEIIGRAPDKDLAVLRIEAPSELLVPLDLGDSNVLEVGQKVFAIGNPFGLDYTLTTGIISALDRQIQAAGFEAKRTISGVIQTDAAINPGNSGGPLLDSQGHLIGVNTALYSPSGAYAGVGFAIPSTTVNRIVPQLLRHGRIIRPDIGIKPFRLVDEETLSGVLIGDIIRGSAADRAGLKPTRDYPVQRGFRRLIVREFGDLIVKADDKRTRTLDDWYSFLESHRVGDEVRLTIIRNPFSRGKRKEMVVDVILEEDSESR